MGESFEVWFLKEKKGIMGEKRMRREVRGERSFVGALCAVVEFISTCGFFIVFRFCPLVCGILTLS